MLNLNNVPEQSSYFNSSGYKETDLEKIAHAFGKPKRNGSGYLCCCCCHEDSKPSLSLSLGEDGRLLVKCFAGCDSSIILEEIKRLGLSIKANGAAASQPLMSESSSLKTSNLSESDWERQGKVQKLYQESMAASGVPVIESYFRRRIPSLAVTPSVLRYHSQAYHTETQSQYRALIAPFRRYPSQEIQGVHVTFLEDGGMGKAAIDPDKKMFGRVKESAIQLYEPTEVLGIAEGIETSLSGHVLCGVPVWAAGSASNMESLLLPLLPLAQKLLIFIDNDKNNASLNSARKLAERAKKEDREVFIVRPPLNFKDFNDAHKACEDQDFDVRTLIESVDGKNIDFLFGIKTAMNEKEDSPEIPEEAYDAVFKELGEYSVTSEEADIALEERPLDPWDYALDRLHSSRKNLFITGAAGTGKSTLLKQFRAETTKKMAVVAPTGVAALNVEGQTIHRFFQFNADIDLKKIKKLSKKENLLYRKIDTLIIDEISMVRADLLDCIDLFLRKNGNHPDRPFGGVRVVMIGDPYQLPPVVKDEEGAHLSKQGYETPYFFSAKCYKNIEIVELTTVYRQQNKEFISILKRIRNKTATPQDLNNLNARVVNTDHFVQEDHGIYLTTSNKKVDGINQAKLDALGGESFHFKAEVSESFNPSEYPAPLDLTLKKGARIMMLNNDSGGRWVNGSLGEIARVEVDSIWMELGENVYLLDPHTWEIGERYLDGDDLKTRNVRSFKQYPLQLAWAITIHKSQGKTFDRAVIDLESVFAEGQTYVALSRCTSLEGIELKTPITSRHILVDQRVTAFLHQARTQPSIEEPEALPDIFVENEENNKEENSKKDSKKPHSSSSATEEGEQTSKVSYLDLPNRTGSDVDLAKHLLHQKLLEEYSNIIYDEGGFWKYGATHWEEISQEELAHILHSYDGKKWIQGYTEQGEPIIKTVRIGENTVKNTLKRLRTEGIALRPDKEEWFNDPKFSITGINCLNGFIQIDEEGNISLEEHQKEHRQRFTIPFQFKPELIKSILNDDCPIWKNSLLRKLLYGCFQGDEDILDKIKLIMEIAGATASNCTLKFKQPKVIIFYGESAENGKSQLCFLLESFLNPKDVCSVDPEHFKDEKQRLTLRNKKLNLVFELSGNALNSEAVFMNLLHQPLNQDH